jgi:ribosomal protein S18 acetylase RimI-like enzyme
MLELEENPIQTDRHLRLMDVRKDLIQVADLIEVCFSNTMDPDGREYLRQMRQAARDEFFLRWAQLPASGGAMPMAGYVWDDDGTIIGNLNLIPLYKQSQRIFLIANVAVHPNFRRRGIARALTQVALDHARRHGASSAWLQVREENRPAYELYRSLGFLERTRRTTWLAERAVAGPNPRPSISITPRQPGDWPMQKSWLSATYPLEVTWNIPFSLSRLRPSLINALYRFLLSERIDHWTARLQGQLIGAVTWEPSRSYADNLWLATTPEHEDLVIREILPLVRKKVASRRPLALNYPGGRAKEAFVSAGFFTQQTLVWMEQPFLAQPSRAI